MIPASSPVPCSIGESEGQARVADAVQVTRPTIQVHEHDFFKGVQQSCTEQPGSSSSQVDGPTFFSSKLPLYAMVPLKKREQIWRGEFVELSTLQEEEPDDILFNVRTGKVSSAPSKKKYLSIEQWTDAFSIYASVFRLKYPEQAESLASYMSLIRRISAERGGWYNYDRQFRKLKANSTTIHYRWDQREDELFFLALSKRQPFRQGREEHFRQGRDVIRKTNKQKFNSCFKYDKGQTCAGCNYPHVCRECGGSHPLFKCWGRNKNSTTANAGSPSQAKGKGGSTMPPNGGSKQKTVTSS